MAEASDEIEAHIRPEWLTDGDSYTVEITGATEFSNRTVQLQVFRLDAVETGWYSSFSIPLDANGAGTISNPTILDFAGRHASIYVGSLQTDSDAHNFRNVLISIVNSPEPGTTLGEALDQHLQLQSDQNSYYAIPVGAPLNPDTTQFRSVTVLEGILTTQQLRVPGATLIPIDPRPDAADRMNIIDGVLADLGWPSRVPEHFWRNGVASAHPMTILVCTEIWANDITAAGQLVAELQGDIISMLALNRGAAAQVVGTMIEERKPDDGVGFRFYLLVRNYTGNLVGGFISGEDQRTLLTEYLAINSDPFLKLCCDLYTEALVERSMDAQFLRLWSLLELLSGARVNSGAVVTRLDGTSWPGKLNTTTYAAPRVYNYLASQLVAGRADEASFVAPASDLYEAVRVWYARRNATGHYGRFVQSDATQSAQSWYQWAARSSTDADAWLRALRSMVEIALHTELRDHAPALP